MKIVTICGSLKYYEEMNRLAVDYTLKGYCVLTPVFSILNKNEYNIDELKLFKDSHFKRIDMCDIVLIVNKNNYIGDSTKLEIEYAKKLGKEIIYLEGNGGYDN